MEPLAYQLMAELEADHWWYRSRRALLGRLLAGLDLPQDPVLLEVGCGSGGNLPRLTAVGRAFGLEPDPDSALRASGVAPVIRARASSLPMPSESVDVVVALDVLEHLYDELVFLDEVRRILRPGGYTLLFVPAYPSLWGPEDIFSHHLRRYRRVGMKRLLEAAALDIEHLGYQNTLLFPLVAAIKLGKRFLPRAFGTRPDVESLPPAWLNELLTILVEAEIEVATTVELPFGASVIAVARKPLSGKSAPA